MGYIDRLILIRPFFVIIPVSRRNHINPFPVFILVVFIVPDLLVSDTKFYVAHDFYFCSLTAGSSILASNSITLFSKSSILSIH